MFLKYSENEFRTVRKKVRKIEVRKKIFTINGLLNKLIFLNEKKKLEIIAMNRLHAIMSFRKFMWKIVACGFYFLFYNIQSFVASEEKDSI